MKIITKILALFLSIILISYILKLTNRWEVWEMRLNGHMDWLIWGLIGLITIVLYTINFNSRILKVVKIILMGISIFGFLVYIMTTYSNILPTSFPWNDRVGVAMIVFSVTVPLLTIASFLSNNKNSNIYEK